MTTRTGHGRGTVTAARGPAATAADGLRLAFGTLTAVPVPPPGRIDRAVAATAMSLAPVAGAVPGLAAAAVALAGERVGASGPLVAAAALGLAALSTRGLHLDGLADTADGLAAAYDRDRALAVMRRGDTGPSGAAALVLVLLVQAAALAQALGRHGPVAALVGIAAGRAALAVACARGVPAARPEGLGATVAGSVPRAVAALVVLAVVGASALLTGSPAAAHAPVAGVAASAVLLARAVQRLGGVTGDVLGAGVETATAATLVGLALLG